ncbi:MAG: uroporphyrinogen decarboxylase family protein [Kiritimatiellae bacterium]|nr:uroporphyrinogen decarboxylase family protein [Kiritimatiellia bacterium]
MSRERYLKALRRQNPEVLPHQIWLPHPEFISDATGVDYHDHPLQASLRFHARYDVDNGGPCHVEDTPLPRPRAGATADGGVRSEEGFGTVWHNDSPFTEPEQLWNFDPDPWGPDAAKAVEPDYALQHYRWCFQPETWPQRRAGETAAWARLEALFPDKFTDGRCFYCTTFMWGICIFGWDVFLMALGLDPDRTGQTLRRLGDVTARMYEYFATCDGALFVVPHDDLCIGTGPVAAPAWYRKYVYPQFEKVFAPVKAAGKPVILTSDGDLRALAPGLAEIVDGFIFESATPADYMFETFGKTKCLVGGIDVRKLTFGTPKDVDAEVKRAVDRGRDCPGYVIACADTIPSNVPLANVYAYFDAVEKCRRR